MSLYDELRRQQFTVQLKKLIPQREEHMATVLRWYPKCYKYRFIPIEEWNYIPKHFFEIFNVIRHKGAGVDGTVYGLYAITLHGKGKEHGQTDADLMKFLAGCIINYDEKKRELKPKFIKCYIRVFLMLLDSIRDVNASLVRG